MVLHVYAAACESFGVRRNIPKAKIKMDKSLRRVNFILNQFSIIRGKRKTIQSRASWGYSMD